MKKYYKNQDTFICFDEEEKSITSVTSHVILDGKSIVYTKDAGTFDMVYQNAQSNANGNGTPGPNTTGWAETTEEVYNQVKEEVKAFIANL